MLKLAGCILLSFSVWLTGRHMSKKLRHKMDVEDGILSLVEYIKNMISSRGLALCDIYKTVKDDRLDISGFYESLHECKCLSLFDALEKLHDNECDKKIQEYAKAFASTIGNCYCSADAADLCDKYISLLRSAIMQIRGEDKKREELCSKLGFICACAVFVLCI